MPMSSRNDIDSLDTVKPEIGRDAASLYRSVFDKVSIPSLIPVAIRPPLSTSIIAPRGKLRAMASPWPTSRNVTPNARNEACGPVAYQREPHMPSSPANTPIAPVFAGEGWRSKRTPSVKDQNKNQNGSEVQKTDQRGPGP